MRACLPCARGAVSTRLRRDDFLAESDKVKKSAFSLISAGASVTVWPTGTTDGGGSSCLDGTRGADGDEESVSFRGVWLGKDLYCFSADKENP